MNEKKIKVLQMPVRNAKGGITQYALRNWKHIDKSKFCFDWVTLDKSLSFEDDLVKQGCRVYHLSCRQEDDEPRFRSEMETIFANNYDAIHLHTGYWRGFLAEELAIKAGIPQIIVHAHSTGVDVSDSVEREKLITAHNIWKEQFNVNLATHFTACSNLAAEFLFGEQILSNKILILKNAVDTEKYSYDEVTRKKLREEMGLNENYVILQPARLEYQKNHVFTLNLFAKVIDILPSAILLLVGDGQLREDLEKLAFELGISNNVRFFGFREDIPSILQASDLVIMPSRFEGLAISAIEAQCSGCWCLFSENITPEIIVSSNAERLPLDENIWRDRIINIAETGYNRCDRSSEIKEAGYSLHHQIKVLERLYSQSVNSIQ